MISRTRFFANTNLEFEYYENFDYSIWLSLMIDKDHTRTYDDPNFAAIPELLTSYRIDSYENS